MAKKKRGEAHSGGHGWFVTFADLMGLLVAFFVMLVAFTCAVTLLTSATNVFYRDVSPVVTIALQLWLYLTPVAYPLAKATPSSRPTASASSRNASARPNHAGRRSAPASPP